jgi:hypothetical protein
VGNADDEADALITLGMIEESDDPAKARSLCAEARARAASAGRPEIELRALLDLAVLEDQLGNLAEACAGFDDGAKLAQRSGLGWSGLGILMRRRQIMVRYLTGDWDESERLAAAVPELVTTLAVAELAAEGLAVQVARGRSVAPKRLSRLVELTGAGSYLDKDVAVREAELATWQGDLDRARSAVQRALAAAEAIEHIDQALEVVWVSVKGLTVEADRAEQARAAGDTVTLTDATAVGRGLLERVRAAAEQAHRNGFAHDVHLRGWLAKAEAEWTRVQGYSDPAYWQAAVEAFSYGHVYAVARCRWRLAEAFLGAGDREQATVVARAAHATAVRLGAEPLRAGLRRWPAEAASTLASGCRPSGP